MFSREKKIINYFDSGGVGRWWWDSEERRGSYLSVEGILEQMSFVGNRKSF